MTALVNRCSAAAETRPAAGQSNSVPIFRHSRCYQRARWSALCTHVATTLHGVTVQGRVQVKVSHQTYQCC